MKRPLWLIGTGILLAIVVAFWVEPKEAMLLSVSLTLTSVVLLLIKKENLVSMVVLGFSLALGLGLGLYNNMVKIMPFQPYKGSDLVVEGLIEEAHKNSQRSIRYTVWARFPNDKLPDSRIVVRDYIGAELEAGDQIRCTIKFNDPKYENTKSFYRREGIPGEGTLTESPQIISESSGDKLRLFFIQLRAKIYAKNNLVLSKDSAALVNGMVFGITDDLDSQLYNDLNRAGTSHLLSVSGLHLSIFSGFILWLLSFSKLNVKLQNLVAMLATVVFALLVGFSPPILRSLVMTLVFLFGRIIDRDSDSISSLGFSAIVIGLAFPHWALSMGLWLSFLSTAGIIVVGVKLAEYLKNRYTKSSKGIYNRVVLLVTASISITMGAYLFTLPLLVFNYGWISLVSPLANLLVGPFSTVIVIVGIITVVLPSSFPFYPALIFITEFSAKTITKVSELLARLPCAIFSFDSAPVFVAFIIIILLVIFVILKKPDKKAMIAVALVSVLIITSGKIAGIIDEKDKIQLIELEGNGTVLIRNQSAVVFGTPDKYSVESLIKYLDYREIETIDALVVTDYPEQINSSLWRLRDNYKINAIIGPDDHYILGFLAENMVGIPVYSSGYATVSFLDGATLTFDKGTGGISLVVGSQRVLISGAKYDIIDKDLIYIDSDGMISKPDHISFDWNYLGKSVYGERKILLPI